jgi:hypothetical protein
MRIIYEYRIHHGVLKLVSCFIEHARGIGEDELIILVPEQ